MEAGVQTAIPEQSLEKYLAVVCELCAATEEAISGLAAGSLPALQEVIPRQESLAARLREMIDSSPSIRGALTSSSQAGGADLAGEIHSMLRRLAVLNVRYSALLNRVRRSVELSLAVCRSCTGSLERSSLPAPAYRTWSCEV